MFFVGHAAVAFILCYGFLKIFSLKVRNIVLPSFALIMLLSIMPDIDIVFKRLGFDLGHRTFTHSLILSLLALSVIFLSFIIFYRQKNEKRKVLFFLSSIYASAYLSHILIGDTMIGPLNIVFPFGIFYVESGIKANSLLHIVVEFSLLVIMSSIIIREHFEMKKLNQEKVEERLILSRYSKTDRFLYPLLILSFIISFVYLIDQNEIARDGNTIGQIIADNAKLILIATLHTSAVVLIAFIWFKSGKY